MIESAASLVGISGAPLMSIRMGEGNNRSARDIMANYFLMLLVLAIGFTPFAILATVSVMLIAMNAALRICTLSLLPLGVQSEIVDGFTAIRQVRFSLPLSFWRKLIYFVALFTLPAIAGADAAFYAEPISDLLGPAVSIAVYFLFMKRKLERRRAVDGPPEAQPPAPAVAESPPKARRRPFAASRRSEGAKRLRIFAYNILHMPASSSTGKSRSVCTDRAAFQFSR